MPRTKQIKKTSAKEAAIKVELLKKIEQREAAILKILDEEDLQYADMIAEHEQVMNLMRDSLIRYKDVRLMDLDSCDILSITSSFDKARGKSKLKRSISASAITDTDAASTISSDSDPSTSKSTHRIVQRSGSSNRAKAPQISTSKTRRSRSLSRTGKKEIPLDFGTARSTMRTPFGQKTTKMTPITPKMKDYNAHPAVMRRPKQNEIAVSLQGSPLMVNAIMTDGINANIPLPDGRVIALQPQNMRFSEIADISLAPDSISDLQQLRDNLTKLCENYKYSRYRKH